MAGLPGNIRADRLVLFIDVLRLLHRVTWLNPNDVWQPNEAWNPRRLSLRKTAYITGQRFGLTENCLRDDRYNARALNAWREFLIANMRRIGGIELNAAEILAVVTCEIPGYYAQGRNEYERLYRAIADGELSETDFREEDARWLSRRTGSAGRETP